MSEPIEVTTEVSQENAVALRPVTGAVGQALPPEQIQKATSQELRVIEVNEALLPAYQKASTLELTDAEITALMAGFPDAAVEIRPHDGLIYLPHIEISNRLNQVLKPGKWSLVCRRHWLDGLTMYGEYVLLIRGCYVGESVGGHPYQPNNPKTNYSDTLESTAAEALRRIAGKRLSCGSQCWIPEYARNWVAKNAVQFGGKWVKRVQNAPGSAGKANPPVTGNPPPGRNVPPKAAQSPPTKQETPFATAESKAKMIGTLQAGLGQPGRDTVNEYFRKIDQLMPNEEVEDLMLTYVPATSGQMRLLCSAIGEFANGQPAKRAFEPNQEPKAAKAKKVEVPRDAEPLSDDPNSPDAKWRVFPMPFGKNAGVCLEDLDKPYLFGLWANYTVETEYNGKPKKAETIAKDTEFRAMLDAAGDHYGFKAN